LTRYRFHLMQTLVREKSSFVSQRFLKFSTLNTAKVFASLFGATCQAVLTEFLSIETLATMPREAWVTVVIAKGKHRFTDPEATVAKRQYAAREASRRRPPMATSVHLVLMTPLPTIRGLRHALTEIDTAIAQQIAAFPHPLASLPGIGPVLAAGLIAEVGNSHRFPSHAHLATCAGLVWNRTPSGTVDADETRLLKTGKTYRRSYLVEAAHTLAVHAPVFRA
jgi:hypothetical protein